MHIKQRLSLVLKGPKKEPSLYNLRIINCQMSCPVGLQLPLTRYQRFFFSSMLNHVSLRIRRPTPSPWACLEKYTALNCQSITLLSLTHLKQNSNIFLCHASQLRFLLDSLKSSSLHAASVFFYWWMHKVHMWVHCMGFFTKIFLHYYGDLSCLIKGNYIYCPDNTKFKCSGLVGIVWGWTN